MPIRTTKFEINTYYHIFNRWYSKKIIFREDKNYERFISLIVKYNKIFDWIKILAYSILPNHFHLIINSRNNWTDISEFMRKIQQSYSMYFKTKYKNKEWIIIKWEPLFSWRFNSLKIDNEDYLKKCLYYVNFNSIHHKIVKNIEDYKWSSYHQLKNKNIFDIYEWLILDELEL